METYKKENGYFAVKTNSGREIVLVNPTDRDWTTQNFILCFGAYGNTVLRVWANSLDCAFDEAIDYIAEFCPGLLYDEQVTEAYNEAIQNGMSEDEAMDEATIDMTIGGNCGNYIASWEWQIVCENPTRNDLKTL